MPAIQLGFKLRTSTNVKTVHLLGSWDNYSGQLPLSKDTAKSGSWQGTFRFPSTTLQLGKRYWYYYIMDGYHVSHDPAQPFTKEPTTGRSLNILDVPTASGAVARNVGDIPLGRGLSPSRIVHPKPSKPYASRKVRECGYGMSPELDELSSHLESVSLHGSFSTSPTSSVSSGTSRSSGGASFSSLSDRSSPASSVSSASSCRCNRFGITRQGKKVMIDCGGARCGYSDESSSGCSSENSEVDDSSSQDEDEVPEPVQRAPPISKKAAEAPKRTKRRVVVATRRRR